MSRRVLIVAYYFPPLGGIGSLRALGHARYLPEYGWDTLVLAPRAGAYHRDDGLRFPEQQVVRSRSLELSRLGKRTLRAGGGDVTAAEVKGIRAGLRRLARGALYFPDAQVGWAPFALHAGRRVLRERPVDIVVSSSFPITSHLVARRLAREAAVPWIAEFRDPWSQLLPPSRRRLIAARLERSLAQDAAGVVMTSPSWAARHARLWGRPVDVIPNGHDLPRSFAGAPSPASPVLGYLGTYYPDVQASLAAVWDSVAQTRRADGRWIEEIRIIGTLDATMATELRRRGLADRVRVTGFLPHAAAVDQLAACSVALLAGPTDADRVLEGQVAAKVWEYLATGLPVIYVGSPDNDVAQLLADHEGTYIVAEGATGDAAVALTSALGSRHVRETSAFSRRARARELAQVFDRVAPK